MLFSDILQRKHLQLKTDFQKLFLDILHIQSHKGDLLLVQVNGFYYPQVSEWTNIENKNPYMIGFGTTGHSDRWHYKFINEYRKNNINELSYTDYVKQFDFDPDRLAELREMEEKEAMSIQLEMLIYLKIWEADLFIKKFYQLATLASGEPYDWHFKIKGSNRDSEGTTGKREEIIRKKIRDRLHGKYPAIGTAIKNAYRTQVRNAISHSTYFFSGRHIHLGNAQKDDQHAQIEVFSFDEWNDLFHDTMVIYNMLIGFYNDIDVFYANLASQNNQRWEIRINRKHPVEKTEYVQLEYRPYFNDWGPVTIA